jgi:hypothetical protein
VARRKIPYARQSVLKSYSVPAPIGGQNSISGLAAMPPEDCVVLWNLFPGTGGLRNRLGHLQHATALTGAPRTVMGFYGSVPASNRLFACTSTGIYDVTSPGAATLMESFADSTGNAGYGTFAPIVTLAGHFLGYVDEVNGYYVYSEISETWVKVVQAASTPWTTGATYAVGAYVTSDGVTYRCVSGAGPAGATAPTGVGDSIDDGGYIWEYAPSIEGFDPAEASFISHWKYRVWLGRKDTAEAWYLDLNAMFGRAVRFSFAGRAKAGGSLRNLWNWTYDGGSGMDDRLVGVLDGGDVVIYEGIDPSVPGAFELKGVWNVGAVPAGRRICTEVGGDLLLLTYVGALPLSKLIIGAPITSYEQYATFKIGNLFNALVAEYGANRGWSLQVHPGEGALVINVPARDGEVSEQLVMSMTTKRWSRFSFPFMSFVHAASYAGKLYYGAIDGTIHVSSGDVDLSNPIEFFVLTSFQKLGSTRQKRVQMVRASVNSSGVAPSYQIKAKYRYDLERFVGGSAVTVLPGDKFGSHVSGTTDTGDALFDTATFFASDEVSEQRVTGASNGIGPEVAIAMSGKTSNRFTLIGWDVFYDEGGHL